MESNGKKLEALETIYSIDQSNIKETLDEIPLIMDEILEKTGPIKLLTYKGLDYEKCVYEFITENIIKEKNISPNFIPLITYKSCLLGGMIYQLPFDKKEKYRKFIELVNILPNICLKFIITGTGLEKSKFKTLQNEEDGEWQPLNFFNRNPSDFRPILFQAVYSLAVMELFGIVHNDLHLNNILLQELPKPIIMSFNINSQTVYIKTKYILKFFDWDRGYVKSLGKNPLLNADYTIESHQVNEARTKQDFYQFLCGLSEYRNIWDLTLKVLPQIPDKKEFYYFYPKRKMFNITIKNSFALKRYMRENQDKIFHDSKDYLWIDLNILFLKSFPEGIQILNQFHKNYPNKFYDDLNSIYVGLKYFLNNGKSTKSFSEGQNVYVNFSPGWHCQSLFDVKDGILPSAKTILFSQEFLSQFSTISSDSGRFERRSYIFPTTQPIFKDAFCTFKSCT